MASVCSPYRLPCFSRSRPTLSCRRRHPLGWVERGQILPEHVTVKFKLDTGALTSSMHAEDLDYFEKDGDKWVRFDLDLKDVEQDKLVKSRIEAQAAARADRARRRRQGRSAGGADEGLRRRSSAFEEEFSLRDRDEMNYPVLLGRRTSKSSGRWTRHAPSPSSPAVRKLPSAEGPPQHCLSALAKQTRPEQVQMSRRTPPRQSTATGEHAHAALRQVRRHDRHLDLGHVRPDVPERVSGRSHFFSETRAYMALVMGASMAIIMLAFMLKMYPHRGVNIAIFAGSALVFAVSLWLVVARQRWTVSWMKAMIPHHSIAILTSERADIRDPQVRQLADSIIEAQRREIAEMKALIDELGPASNV